MKINKVLKIFITIVLLVSIEVTAIAATTGVVNVDTVRVRKEATTSSAIVELVSIGDKINIIGEENGWYKVKVNGTVGYIRNDLLTVEGKVPEETPTEKPENNNDTPTKIENNDSNTGASTETPETNTGTTTENPEEKTNENIDNINSSNNDTTISTIKITEGVSVGGKVQLTKETKIKILPSANSSNIVELQANTEVIVLEIINRWCRVETGEYTGWVRIDQ